MNTPPQFCPWCGTPIPYDEHEHESRHEALAEQARAGGREPPPLPERIDRVLSGESFVGVCAGCRRINHVISHEAREG